MTGKTTEAELALMQIICPCRCALREGERPCSTKVEFRPYEARLEHRSRGGDAKASRGFASCLSESAGLTLGLEEGEDVVLLDGALDVADDGSAGLVHELDAHLDDTTARAGTAEDLSNL